MQGRAWRQPTAAALHCMAAWEQSAPRRSLPQSCEGLGAGRRACKWPERGPGGGGRRWMELEADGGAASKLRWATVLDAAPQLHQELNSGVQVASQMDRFVWGSCGV